MLSEQQICVVEDMFFITGRGPVIIPGQWREGELKPGDWIELRSPEQSLLLRATARVKSIEGVRFGSGSTPVVDVHHPGALLLSYISREQVHQGDQVWLIAAPPEAGEVAEILPLGKVRKP